jgi:SAM-dependent methyltransferase
MDHDPDRYSGRRSDSDSLRSCPVVQPRDIALALVGRLLPAEWVWTRTFTSEVKYWADWLAQEGGESRSDYLYRVDPTAELRDPLVTTAMDQIPTREISVLDVGAGPLTVVGKRYRGRHINVTAIDPLAHEYDRLLAEHGITPPVRTIYCPGEEISSRLGNGQFDLVYARNSVDHSVDPLKVIREMVTAVRPGGVVLLRHFLREAKNVHYYAIHQWNFDIEDGDLTLTRPFHSYNVTGELAPEARTRVWLERSSPHAPWVCAVVTKHGGVP